MGASRHLPAHRSSSQTCNTSLKVSPLHATTPRLLQVAGRAGRYGSAYSRGVVTALRAEDLDTLRGALGAPSEPLEAAYVFPSLGQLELLHGQHPQVGHDISRRAQWPGRCPSAQVPAG